ncbi:unnamed protein product, partial [Phaeothamnion confervicola]
PRHRRLQPRRRRLTATAVAKGGRQQKQLLLRVGACWFALGQALRSAGAGAVVAAPRLSRGCELIEAWVCASARSESDAGGDSADGRRCHGNIPTAAAAAVTAAAVAQALQASQLDVRLSVLSGVLKEAGWVAATEAAAARAVSASAALWRVDPGAAGGLAAAQTAVACPESADTMIARFVSLKLAAVATAAAAVPAAASAASKAPTPTDVARYLFVGHAGSEATDPIDLRATLEAGLRSSRGGLGSSSTGGDLSSIPAVTLGTAAIAAALLEECRCYETHFPSEPVAAVSGAAAAALGVDSAWSAAAVAAAAKAEKAHRGCCKSVLRMARGAIAARGVRCKAKTHEPWEISALAEVSLRIAVRALRVTARASCAAAATAPRTIASMTAPAAGIKEARTSPLESAEAALAGLNEAEEGHKQLAGAAVAAIAAAATTATAAPAASAAVRRAECACARA